MGQPSFDWDYKFKHAGHRFYVTGKYLGGLGETAVGGEVYQGNLPEAEGKLFANTIKTIKADGKVVLDMDKKGRIKDFPKYYDPETKKSAMQIIMEHLVNVREPQALDVWGDCFERYQMDEEPEDGMDAEESSEKPTGRSSGALIEFPDEEAM